jgi:hypothetical protein
MSSIYSKNTPGIPNGVFNPGYFLSFLRSVLKQEITPALMARFGRPEAKRNRSSASGGVRYTVPVNDISSEEAMRFGLDSSNPGHKMMCDMGWKGGSIGKLNDGIATALTGKSIGGQTNRSGVGSQQQFNSRVSASRRNNNIQEYQNRRDQDRCDRGHQPTQFKSETTRTARWTGERTESIWFWIR